MNQIKVAALKPMRYNLPMTNKMILISQFAKRAGVTVQAIHKAMKAKRLTRVERLGPVWLIHPSELKKFKGGK